jgi:putative endonuclease
MHPKDAIGRYGEQLAAHHLRRTGLTLLARNWRCPEGEVDIVARDGDVLVFCEVKTRSSTAFGWPAEAVGGAKAARLRRLAACYLTEQRPMTRRGFWPDVRFDVVSVVQERPGVAQVEHLRGVL